MPGHDAPFGNHGFAHLPGVLRAGGLGVRDLRATAELLDLEEPHAALIVETAYAAGLLADSGEFEPTWVPTAGYDVWLERSIAERAAAHERRPKTGDSIDELGRCFDSGEASADDNELQAFCNRGRTRTAGLR